MKTIDYEIIEASRIFNRNLSISFDITSVHHNDKYNPFDFLSITIDLLESFKIWYELTHQKERNYPTDIKESISDFECVIYISGRLLKKIFYSTNSNIYLSLKSFLPTYKWIIDEYSDKVTQYSFQINNCKSHEQINNYLELNFDNFSTAVFNSPNFENDPTLFLEIVNDLAIIVKEAISTVNNRKR